MSSRAITILATKFRSKHVDYLFDKSKPLPTDRTETRPIDKTASRPFKLCSVLRVPHPTQRGRLWRLGLPRDSLEHISGRHAYILGAFWTLNPSSEAPTPLLAMVALIVLPFALWAYKCVVMVLFQRKIVYMGYVPTDARTQELVQSILPKGLDCEEVQISSEKRILLHGIVARRKSDVPIELRRPNVVLVYLQGNSGNPLMRFPVFERLLVGPPIPSASEVEPLSLAILAIAPRSYWKSSNCRPTEKGILADYRHVLSYALQRFPSSSIVLYGHSLGGAVSICLTSQLCAVDFPSVEGLILENPFSSIPGMVKALYPQRWLPYHHLGVFVFDKWDALSAVQNASHSTLLRRLSSSTMIFLSKNDELVPNAMGESLFEASEALCTGPEGAENLVRRKVMLRNSLHENAWKERLWLKEMRTYLRALERRSQS